MGSSGINAVHGGTHQTNCSVAALNMAPADEQYHPKDAVKAAINGTMITGAVGGTYEFTRFASANLREKDDSLNTALGGFLAGSVLGLRFGSTPAVLGFGALTAVVLGAYDYTGGALTGYRKDPEMDEFGRKEALRKNRRRPIDQTISEIGEGRGIYAPGYDERRRERIKEKYGIEVPAKS